MSFFDKVDCSGIMRHRGMIYGFCALWLMFFHAEFVIPKVGLFQILRVIKAHGACCVEVFLLLSAVGLYHSFSRSRNILSFYKRRFIRVFVPSFIVMTIFQSLLKHSLPDYFLSATFIGYWFNCGKTIPWFVPFILTMYLTYPLIFNIQKLNRWSLPSLIILCLVLIFFSNQMYLEQHDSIKRGISRIPIFLVGCWIAPVIDSRYSISKIKLVGYTVFSMMAMLLYIELKTKIPILDGYSYRAIAYGILSIGIVLTLWYAGDRLCNSRRLGRVVYRFLTFYGSFSLECYLIYVRIEKILWAYYNPAISDTGTHILICWYALFYTTIAGFCIRRLCYRLIECIQNIPLPEKV